MRQRGEGSIIGHDLYKRKCIDGVKWLRTPRKIGPLLSLGGVHSQVYVVVGVADARKIANDKSTAPQYVPKFQVGLGAVHGVNNPFDTAQALKPGVASGEGARCQKDPSPPSSI